jgi:hypothetical protein
MATLDPIVFNRLRLTIDEFTDAAHRLVQQLDGESDSAACAVKEELQRHRDLIAALGCQLDSSDPDGGDVAEAWGTA